MTHQTKLLEMGAVTAYGIALQHGFVGTIQEWLDSLHARIGENGNWWVGDVDTGVLADPAKLRELTELARNAASVAVTAADSAVISNDEAENALRGAEAARDRAESAAIHQPIPNAETETWWVWDSDKSAYVDSGVGYSATEAEITQLKSDLAAEQTARDAADSALRADLTANANADEQTRRKLDALWKLNQGISYQFETDDAEAYQKTVPSGAKLANVNAIGGNTEVIDGELVSADVESIVNHGKNLFDCYGFSAQSIERSGAKRFLSGKYGTVISTTDPGNEIIVNQIEAQIPNNPGSYQNGYFCIGVLGLTPGNRYVVSFDVIPTKMLMDIQSFIVIPNGYGSYTYSTSPVAFSIGKKMRVKCAFLCVAYKDRQYIELRNDGLSGIFSNFQIEKGGVATQYSPFRNQMLPIPPAVRALPGYGWSAGEVCNSIERTETGWQYVQRVGSKDYQDGDTVTDGTTTYYALDTPIITDITELMDGVLDEITVEDGGTLTFENAAKLPMPNSVEYAVKLSEVTQ